MRAGRDWLSLRLDMGELGVEGHLPLVSVSGALRLASAAGSVELAACRPALRDSGRKAEQEGLV